MDIIIQSTINTLQKSKFLLEKLTDEELCNRTVSPYYSSIGTHIRHILDFYECVFNVDSKSVIDLTARPRNAEVETKCDYAKDYLEIIEDRLKAIDISLDKRVSVIDDLGLGKIEIPYTFGALLAQANSHTIHHYAIINYIFDRLGIQINDDDFGYNPTTPKPSVLN